MTLTDATHRHSPLSSASIMRTNQPVCTAVDNSHTSRPEPHTHVARGTRTHIHSSGDTSPADSKHKNKPQCHASTRACEVPQRQRPRLSRDSARTRTTTPLAIELIHTGLPPTFRPPSSHPSTSPPPSSHRLLPLLALRIDLLLLLLLLHVLVVRRLRSLSTIAARTSVTRVLVHRLADLHRRLLERLHLWVGVGVGGRVNVRRVPSCEPAPSRQRRVRVRIRVGATVRVGLGLWLPSP